MAPVSAEAPRAIDTDETSEPGESELAEEETMEAGETLLQPANRLYEASRPEDFEEPEPRVSRRLLGPRRMSDLRGS